MRRFFIVDVFAEQRYEGNQLAVVLDCEGLTTEDMQAITREMNYSETTFIIDADEARVRIFTPGEEVPFAGHPTLGTAFIIQQEILKTEVPQLAIKVPAGTIPVTFSYVGGMPDVLWMRQLHPAFGRTIDPGAMAELLNISVSDLDSEFLIQEVSTGLPFIIVPLKSLDACRRARPQGPDLLRFVAHYEAKNILVFTLETCKPENQLHVRVFTDYLGIPEDPATGSANGCLAAYLTRYQYFGCGPLEARVEQGYEMGRPSLLLLRGQSSNGDIIVDVGGRVIPVASGMLL